MSTSISMGGADGHNPKHSTTNRVQLDFATARAYWTGLVTDLRQRITLETVRPLSMFLGISGHAFCLSPDAFTPPVRKIDKSTVEKFKSRLRLNFAFFLSNYALVAAGVCLVIALMHPGMLVSIGLLWGLWALHEFLISNELIIFGHNVGMLVSITHRSAFLTALTFLVIVWKCLAPAITAVAISGLLIFAHALLRDPKHIESSRDFRRPVTDGDDENGLSDSEVLVERPFGRSEAP